MSRRKIINVFKTLVLCSMAMTMIVMAGCRYKIEVDMGVWADTAEGRKCIGSGNECTKSVEVQAEPS